MKKLLGLMIVMAALLTGCSPYNLVTSTTYNDADLSAYHTFRIVTPDEGKLPPGMEMVTYYNIAAAVREQMVERGFTEDPSSPLLINLGLTVKKGLITEPALPPAPNPPAPLPMPAPVPPAGMHPGPGPHPHAWGPVQNGVAPWFMYPRNNYWPPYNPNVQVVTGIYKEGVLTMDMVNMTEKLPLFSASVGTILDNGDTQFRNLQGIAEAVQTLFSKFPVPILPQYKGK
ncbi:MAG: DUF4136 domain-containing protein [Duncaniella sp.]|nr:DUF4136 domain-containing protein [Duncaniella sp.]